MRSAVVGSSGLRLDRWLAEHHPEVSRARWQEWIEAGEVLLNGKPTKPSTKLRVGDRLEYTLPPDRPPDYDLRPESIPITILYEDADLIVVGKPRGLTVHPAPGHPHGTLVNALLAHSPQLAPGFATFRPGIVHRLDKDTTGLLLVAKTDRAHALLSHALQKRALHRHYLALVWGTPTWEHTTVDLPIGRHPVNRQKMSVFPHEAVARGQAKPARTHFRVKARYQHFTLLEAALDTGRTHQVRVHASAMGHPVVGDPLYGGVRTPPADCPPVLAERLRTLQGQLLHAYRIEFTHPTTHERMAFTAPLPEDFEQILEILNMQEPR